MMAEHTARSGELRGIRSKLKSDIADGKRSLGVVLMDPPACAERMKVGDLLVAAHGMGRQKSARLLRRARLSGLELVCELSPEDRWRLLFAMPRAIRGCDLGGSGES